MQLTSFSHLFLLLYSASIRLFYAPPPKIFSSSFSCSNLVANWWWPFAGRWKRDSCSFRTLSWSIWLRWSSCTCPAEGRGTSWERWKGAWFGRPRSLGSVAAAESGGCCCWCSRHLKHLRRGGKDCWRREHQPRRTMFYVNHWWLFFLFSSMSTSCSVISELRISSGRFRRAFLSTQTNWKVCGWDWTWLVVIKFKLDDSK